MEPYLNRADPAAAQRECELVRRCQAGDDAAFDGLVDSTKRPAYEVAFRWTRDRDLAMDVLQDAYVRLYRALPSWDFSCRVSTWLYRVVTNLCVDRHRRGGWRLVFAGQAATEHDEPLHHSGHAPSPATAMEEAERAQAVHACVRRLPQRMREAVHLRYFSGLSLEEISQVQRCSVGTIKATLHQAVRKLKPALQELTALDCPKC